MPPARLARVGSSTEQPGYDAAARARWGEEPAKVSLRTDFARDRGRFDAVHEGLFRAFFQDGRDLAAVPVLKEVAAGAGLDPDALGAALAEGYYTAGVLAEEALARDLGLGGVPATVVGGVGAGERVLVSGAQPAEVLERAVRRFA